MRVQFDEIDDGVEVVGSKFVKRVLDRFAEEGVLADTGDHVGVVVVEQRLAELMAGTDWLGGEFARKMS